MLFCFGAVVVDKSLTLDATCLQLELYCVNQAHNSAHLVEGELCA